MRWSKASGILLAIPERQSISSPSSSLAGQSGNALVSAVNPATVADVIAEMQSIDALLPANDGLKWFNRLYLMVTDQVRSTPTGGAWQNPAWLDHLDVVFAGLYFDALRASLAGERTPSSWAAMFQARFTPGIDRIQFALAGMNAHINHDLSLALLKTSADMNMVPAPDGPEYRDYQSVNNLLGAVMPSALNMLAGDALGFLAQDTGKVGRLLAFWNICSARNLAWDFANHLRDLSGPARDTALALQDGITGALGRAILAQV
jgi:hypothetical protein